MKTIIRLLSLTLLTFGAMGSANAALITFITTLSGANEAPTPNASPGTGFASAVYDDVANTLAVNVTWANLTGPAAAGHIHCCAPIGSNAGVRIPFALGTPVATGTFSGLFINLAPDLVAGILNELAYVNLHTASFPAGEIRGQLRRVPEPATLGLIGLAMLGAGLARRRRQS